MTVIAQQQRRSHGKYLSQGFNSTERDVLEHRASGGLSEQKTMRLTLVAQKLKHHWPSVSTEVGAVLNREVRGGDVPVLVSDGELKAAIRAIEVQRASVDGSGTVMTSSGEMSTAEALCQTSIDDQIAGDARLAHLLAGVDRASSTLRARSPSAV